MAENGIPEASIIANAKSSPSESNHHHSSSTKQQSVVERYKEFLRDDFTIDDYIKDHSSLEQLRQDLGTHLRTCRLALVDLINDNYTDFISLADGLVGMDSSIKNLIGSLEIFRENISKMENEYKAIIDEISAKMVQVERIQTQREQLESVINICDNLQVITKLCDTIESASWNADNNNQPCIYSIERLAIQMNEINIVLARYSSDLKSSYLDTQLVPQCYDISKRLKDILKTTFHHSITHSNGPYLQRLFKIYAINGQLKSLEKLFLAKVRPHFVSVVSDSRLEACGVGKFFDDLKNLLVSQMKVFIPLENECRSWYLSMIWSELISTMSSQSPTLFLSGQPDQFHSNYIACTRFLQCLAAELNDEVTKISESVNFSSLTRKFNVDVYFRIRFQEIASRFEQSLTQSYTYQPNQSKKFRIHPLEVLIESIKTCWSVEKVYLNLLFPNFWKLTLQLISRCTTWLGKTELSHLNIENVSNQESTRLKCSLLSTIFSQTEKALLEIRDIYKTMIVPLKPTSCDERQLKESLEDGLLLITEAGLPNIVKLSKECLVKRN
ncbi:conserved oligomeric Golgi complex subunit 2 [Brevipalpus obovatus]|uniref:conserved oligomeric Golgi complex subunit 2 n=1 Tax=Brevipalpus obovatus TaxID=246614 RepID=UPI003D9E878C